MGGKHRGRQMTKSTSAENDYVVERIVDDRITKGKVQYKVHWEGYGTDEETWENESQLNCPELLEEYIAKTQNDDEESSRGSSARKKKSKSSRASRSVRNETAPSTSAVDAAETSYEVEKILDDRMVNGQLQYKVHWVGYSTDEETWEYASNLDCPDLIKEYEKMESDESEKKSVMKKPTKKKKQEPAHQDEEPSAADEYEVERILEMRTLKNRSREFLVKWVGYSKEESTWEPERNLEGTDLLKQFLLKVEKAKELSTKELRVNRRPTDRFTATPQGDKRRLSKRYANKQRVKYYEAE